MKFWLAFIANLSLYGSVGFWVLWSLGTPWYIWVTFWVGLIKVSGLDAEHV